MDRIVLAYSGGLYTSAAISGSRRHYQAEIVAVTMDLGQGLAPRSGPRSRAGDRRPQSACARPSRGVRDDFCSCPPSRGDVLNHDRSPMTAALGRPLIARKLVEIAEIENAQAVAHGGGANWPARRARSPTRALNPRLKIIAPARDWDMTRPDVVAYAGSHVIPSNTVLSQARQKKKKRTAGNQKHTSGFIWIAGAVFPHKSRSHTDDTDLQIGNGPV